MSHLERVAEPSLWFVGEWSLRWAALIAGLAAALLVCRPRRAGTRHLACVAVFCAGLLLPLAPRWGPGWVTSAPRASRGREPAEVEVVKAPDSRAEKKTPGKRISREANPGERIAGGSRPRLVGGMPGDASPRLVEKPAPVPAAPREVRRWVVLGLSLAWAGGALLLLVRLGGGVVLLGRWRRQGREVGGEDTELLRACSEEIGLRRQVRLGVHPHVRSPITLGLFRPTVLVPAGWGDLPREARRGCLLHELAHLARRDDWWGLLFEAVRAVFFFHLPLHWLLARIARERELLCDERAVSLGVDPRDYARVLLDFGRRPGRHVLAGPGLASPLCLGRGHTVRARIDHLLEEDMERKLKPLSWSWAVVLGLGVVAGGLGVGSVRLLARPAEEPAPEKERTPRKGPAAPAEEGPAKEPGLKPGQVLRIQVAGTLPDQPIDGPFRVQRDGVVVLGPAYGTVRVVGLTRAGATEAIREHLKQVLREPRVAVSLEGDSDLDPVEAGKKVPREALRYGGKSFEQWRAELLTELKPDLRIDGIKALGRFGAHGYGEEATEAILQAVRGYDMTPGKVLTMFTEEDMKVVDAASGAIQKIGDPAVPALVEGLKGDNDNARLFVISVLRNHRFAEGKGEIGRGLLRLARETKDPVIRREVIGLLDRYGEAKDVVPVLTAALGDEDAEVRQNAVWGIQNVGKAARPAVPALVKLAEDPLVDGRTVLRALEAAGADAEVVVPVLVKAVKEDEKGTRAATEAVRYLGRLGPKAAPAVPGLVARLESLPNHQHSLWSEIVAALGAIGPAAREAVPVLERYVRYNWKPDEVRQALNKIRGEDK